MNFLIKVQTNQIVNYESSFHKSHFSQHPSYLTKIYGIITLIEGKYRWRQVIDAKVIVTQFQNSNLCVKVNQHILTKQRN